MGRFRYTLLSGALAVALGTAYPCAALAAESMVINDIEVRGLNRVTLGAVLLALPVQQGDVLDNETAALSLKRLYATGNFEEVKISQNNGAMIVTVKERPTIGNVELAGNSQIEEEQLRDVIETQGLRAGEALNVQALTEIANSLEDFYHSAGMYQAQVKPILTYLPRNRVDIKLEFNEGVSAEIEQINIVGNTAFDEDVLLAQMELKDYVPWWNFMADRKYVSEKFTSDLEALTSYYKNRGYIQFKIENTAVELTPDKKGIYLTIVVNEGALYTIGKTSLHGDTLKYGEQMQTLLTVLEEGNTYSAQEVSTVEKALQDYMGKFGYANSQIKAIPTYNDDTHTVDLEFHVEPGRRIYVARVDITGNTSTDDTVIRRELRQMDGTWLSNEATTLSENRLNRTGFFEEVKVQTVNVSSTPDTVILDTKIKEQPTGAISGGIGYGTNSGFLINAGVSQNNVFGWGSRAAVSAYKNDYRQHAEMSYNEPYFTVDQISLGGKVYYDKFEGDDAEVLNYDNEVYGFEISSGYPLSEILYVRYGLGIEENKITSYGETFVQAIDFWNAYGTYGADEQSASFLLYNGSVTLTRNNLDRSVFPTSGSKQVASAYATIPGSDLQFYKLGLETYHYFPIDDERDFVIAAKGRGAYGNGYGEVDGYDQTLPFFSNFYLGGSEWLRGFDYNSVGPKAIYTDGTVSDDSLGGNALWAASFELVIPTPFLAEAYKRQVRTAVFFDAGALWDTESETLGLANYDDASEYRTSAGIYFTWMSPIGPLNITLAKPIKDYAGDDDQLFNFNFGGTF